MVSHALASLAGLSVSAGASGQPCHPGPRPHDTDHAAYEAKPAASSPQAKVLACLSCRGYELDHAVGLFADWQAVYRMLFGYPPAAGTRR
jgi:hypothetical protein